MGTLNPAPQQTVTKITLKTTQPNNIKGAVINPRRLNECYITECSQPEKWDLIQVREPVVH